MELARYYDILRNVPYVDHAATLQTLDIYFAKPEGADASQSVPARENDGSGVWVIYIHGGAWRDPLIDKTSIEPALLQLQDLLSTSGLNPDRASSVTAIASLNYRLSPYPDHSTHPTHPDPSGARVPKAPSALRRSSETSSAATATVISSLPSSNQVADPARSSVHPDHIHDVQAAVRYLQQKYEIGRNYVLVGHSCGATLAWQVFASRWCEGGSERRHRLEITTTSKGVAGNDIQREKVREDNDHLPLPKAVAGVEGIYDLVLFALSEGKAYHGINTNLQENESTWSRPYVEILLNAFGQCELSHADWECIKANVGAWDRASPTSLVRRLRSSDITDYDECSKINNSRLVNQRNQNVEDNPRLDPNFIPDNKVQIVLAHSDEDELVGWRQLQGMAAALRFSGWEERDGSDEGSDMFENDRTGSEPSKFLGNGKVDVVKVSGSHDEIWRDGKELAKIIVKAVRLVTVQ